MEFDTKLKDKDGNNFLQIRVHGLEAHHILCDLDKINDLNEDAQELHDVLNKWADEELRGKEHK